MKRVREMLRRLPAWILTIVTLAVIFWLTLAPHPVGDMDIPLFPGADKIVHALMFGFLTFVILLDLSRGGEWRKIKGWELIISAAASIALGVVIEYIQRAMNLGRSFDILDMAADAVGPVLAVILWKILARYQ